jgi:hypothetical protein
VSTSGLELNWTGYDIDGDQLTFDLYFGNEPFSISAQMENSRVIRNSNVTSYFVENEVLEMGKFYYWTVIPFDGFSYGKCNDSVFVFLVNTPPTISYIPDQTVTVEEKFEYFLIGNDLNSEDAGNLDYSLVSAPEGMTVEPISGTLTWTPNQDQVGEHVVEVQVSDGKDVVLTSFFIKVIDDEIQETGATSKGDDTSLFPILALVIFVIVIIIIFSFGIIRYKKRKKGIISDVEYIPPYENNAMLAGGLEPKPGMISTPPVIIDQVATGVQQTQIPPTTTPGQIPSIQAPTVAKQPQLPPAAVKSPTSVPTTTPIPITLPEPTYITSEGTEIVPEFGLEGGPKPVEKDVVIHNNVHERVVEKIDFDSATTNLQTAAVVEPTEESVVVYNGDTNIWKPDLRGKVAESKEVLEQLERLVELKAKGALTDAEFEKKKKELLG